MHLVEEENSKLRERAAALLEQMALKDDHHARLVHSLAQHSHGSYPCNFRVLSICPAVWVLYCYCRVVL